MSGRAGDVAAVIAARLAQVWRASRPTILERIAALQSAHAALVANAHDTQARSDAREAAHKLSGVLGVFGMPEGSEIAHNLEERLRTSDPIGATDLIAIAGEIETLASMVAAKGEG
jgi:HPt (histidine-containing phosphotransfer) domain-containing protein